jgi:SAM-dependent methyltransferase
MCNVACIQFGAKALKPAEVEGKSVLEIGSIDVNGSLRPIVEAWAPGEYVGIDMAEGPGVDRVCSAENMVKELGADRFDVVIATEIIEHVKDWRTVISNIKNVCKPGGVMLVTSPSRGFPYHAYPHDFWRYETSDMTAIFGDCTIELLESSPHATGVFLKARKPQPFRESDLSGYALYSIIADARVREVTDAMLRRENRMRFVFHKITMPFVRLVSRAAQRALKGF